jgi:hypothetical protein
VLKNLLLVLFVLSAAQLGFAQDSVLWIDGIELKLGMPKEQVRKLFSVKHELERVEDSDGWVIVKKGSENNVVENAVGQVAFEGGRLKWASQIWGRFRSADALELGSNLFGALNSIHESGEIIVTAKTSRRRSPKITMNSIELTYKTKKVLITIVEGRNLEKSVVIEEQVIR